MADTYDSIKDACMQRWGLVPSAEQLEAWEEERPACCYDVSGLICRRPHDGRWECTCSRCGRVQVTEDWRTLVHPCEEAPEGDPTYADTALCPACYCAPWYLASP